MEVKLPTAAVDADADDYARTCWLLQVPNAFDYETHKDKEATEAPAIYIHDTATLNEAADYLMCENDAHYATMREEIIDLYLFTEDELRKEDPPPTEATIAKLNECRLMRKDLRQLKLARQQLVKQQLMRQQLLRQQLVQLWLVRQQSVRQQLVRHQLVRHQLVRHQLVRHKLIMRQQKYRTLKKNPYV
ncbi:hypothetical protein CYMTET_32597 [Cymbomonas tetramitiformis]|uniref:Uncharacterized protein n=1 Tax=Cymbomonas tetramitiformis TaxID=36881 RepID=A0AAE0FEF5_9CHLO|nr:hypothetical protein CYMTET_32597 [Cymbomonas tetramitiformis]